MLRPTSRNPRLRFHRDHSSITTPSIKTRSRMPINSSNISFAFGPGGSFFFEAPGIRRYCNLPGPFAYFLEKNTDARVKCLNLLPDGCYVVLYEDYKGEGGLKIHTKLPLTKELEALKIFRKRRDVRTLKFNVHSGHSFYATALNERHIPDYEVRWCGLPFEVEWRIQSKIIANCWDESRPVQVLRGLDDAYAILLAGGGIISECKARYPKLDDDIHTAILTGKKVVHIAMNPYHEDQHFILFHDGTSKWNLSAAYDYMVREVATVILNSNTIRGSVTLSSGVLEDPHIAALPQFSSSSSPPRAAIAERDTRRNRPSASDLWSFSSRSLQNTSLSLSRAFSPSQNTIIGPESGSGRHDGSGGGISHERVSDDVARDPALGSQKRKVERLDAVIDRFAPSRSMKRKGGTNGNLEILEGMF